VNTFTIPCYAKGSNEFETYITVVTEGRKNKAARARHTTNSNKRKPPLPSLARQEMLRFDEQWCRFIGSQSDAWWFKRIDNLPLEGITYRKVNALIWWSMGSDDADSYAAWKDRWAGWDYQADSEADWSGLEHILHLVGCPPTLARRMAMVPKPAKELKRTRKEF